MDKVFAELGNSSAQLRIMIVLIGTKPGFRISEKWMCDRTGLKQPSYITARKALIEKGWLSLVNNETITVNFKNILCKKEDNTETKNIGHNTILSQQHNTILCERDNTTLCIIDKEKNKEIDKETVDKFGMTREIMKHSTDNKGNFIF